MRARRLVLGLFAFLVLACGAARAAQDDVALIDDLVRQGDEAPDSAIRAIGELSNREFAVTPLVRRASLTGIGIVQARNGRVAEALAQVAALTEFGRTEPLADADAHLVRAEIEVNGGHMASSYQQARAALAVYSEACAPGPRHDAACNYRDWWRALDMAQRGAADQGNAVIANGYAQTLLDVARRNGDRPREAISLGVAALQAEANADSASANRLIAQAQHVARADGSAWVQVRVAVLGGLLHFRRQQPEAVQRLRIGVGLRLGGTDPLDAMIHRADAGGEEQPFRRRQRHRRVEHHGGGDGPGVVEHFLYPVALIRHAGEGAELAGRKGGGHRHLAQPRRL